MSRANLSGPELSKVPHFYFYVDEFQNFANETFAEILSESRKYKLDLIITNQYIEQMEEPVRDAVFGNVGTTVAFRVGPFDAEVLETIFMPKFTKEDVVALDKRQIYLTLMIDGVGSAPFSAVTIPPIEVPPVSYREQIIASSRAQFTTPRAGIENSIMEELTASLSSESPFDARMKKKPAQRPPGQSAPAQRPPMQRASAEPPNASQRSSDLPVHAPQGGARPFVHRPPVSRPPASRPPMERPVLPSKSADDLKAILRNMTAKTNVEREQKEMQNKQSLKGTLVEVLGKSTAVPTQEVPKSAAAEPLRDFEKVRPSPIHAEGQKPFEVPEDELRKVLKGEK
jgi:hypothetical protein